jgi:flagellar motor protein MotB
LATLRQPIGELSGGNQQKAVLARWLRTEPRVLLLDEPTQGVDVGAKAAIYQQIAEAAREGMAVLIASSDAEELVHLCDRVLVLRAGMVSAELAGANLTEERLVAETLGATSDRKNMKVAREPVLFTVIRDDIDAEPEVDDGLVTVTQKGNAVTILIAGKGMFKPGSDTLEPAFKAPLDRIAGALKDTAGPLLVVGHTDSVPTGKTSRFASNTELSLARAEKVRAMMAGILGPDRALTAEGRGEAEPLVGNDTPENRARNRRIEIVLIREQST